MNKLSQLALEVSQDIYSIGGTVEKARNQLNNFEITPSQYANTLYITACKTNYLREVVEALRERGYKFRNYAKEMLILDAVTDIFDEDFEILEMRELSENDLKPFVELTKKYQKVVPIYNLDDDLKVE